MTVQDEPVVPDRTEPLKLEDISAGDRLEWNGFKFYVFAANVGESARKGRPHLLVDLLNPEKIGLKHASGTVTDLTGYVRTSSVHNRG